MEKDLSATLSSIVGESVTIGGVARSLWTLRETTHWKRQTAARWHCAVRLDRAEYFAQNA